MHFEEDLISFFARKVAAVHAIRPGLPGSCTGCLICAEENR